MSKKANPKIVGLFVLGAIILTVAGVLVFGASNLFQPTKTFVSFFKGSVKGLSVGAPVAFRGVNIGKVSNILVSINPKNEEIQIPVLMTLQLDQISFAGETAFSALSLERLIKQGLRAQLVVQSLVTGQLMIELDFHPESKIRYVGAMPQYPEVPTVPSDLEKLLQRVEELPLEKIANSLNRILEAVNKITSSGYLDETIKNLANLTGHIDQLAVNLDQEVRPTVRNLNNTLENADGLVTDTREGIKSTLQQLEATIARADRLLQAMQGEASRITGAVEETAKATRDTLAEAKTSVNRFGRLAATDSPVVYNLKNALQEIASSAKALRSLAEYLERHPEALLKGKGGY